MRWLVPQWGCSCPAVPVFGDVLAGSIRDGENSEDGIEAAVSYVDATINNENIFNVVDATVRVDNRSFGIIAHAAGAGLMLAAA